MTSHAKVCPDKCSFWSVDWPLFRALCFLTISRLSPQFSQFSAKSLCSRVGRSVYCTEIYSMFTVIFL